MKFNHLCFLAVFKNLFCNSPFGEIFLNLSLQFCLFWWDEGIQNWGWGQKRGWGPWRCEGDLFLLSALPSLMFPTFPWVIQVVEF